MSSIFSPKRSEVVNMMVSAVKTMCSRSILEHKKCPLCNSVCIQIFRKQGSNEWKAVCKECKEGFHSTRLHLIAKQFTARTNIAIYSLALMNIVTTQVENLCIPPVVIIERE